MGRHDEADAADKASFEPSELIEYGEADHLTRGPRQATQVDGSYTS